MSQARPVDQEARSISACIIRDERLSFLSTSNFIPVSVQSTIFSVSIDETDIASDFSSNPSFFYHVVESKNFHLSPFIGNIFGFILFSFLLIIELVVTFVLILQTCGSLISK